MNNKGNCRPRLKPSRLARHVWVSMALLSAAGCGGGGDGTAPSSVEVDLVGFPAAADPHEGAAGDDTPAAAVATDIGSRQSRTLFPAGDEDYVKLTLAAGTSYEFSANRLNYTGDTELFLLAADGATVIDSNDDYIGLDSRIQYTPTTAGTYYLRIEAVDTTASDDQLDVASYVLSAHVYTDTDGDRYSSYYDCNDRDASVYPLAPEVAGDGVDQDCSGADAPTGATPDSAEDDETIATARVMAPVSSSPFEPLFERPMHLANTRSLTVDDEDYLSVEIPARGAVEIDLADANLTVSGALYAANGTPIGLPEPFPYFHVVNVENAPKTIYVKYAADSPGASGYYVPFYASLGVDLDGDTYYTQDWIQLRDCNDGDAGIHPRATDASVDGVDQNCDGRDGP